MTHWNLQHKGPTVKFDMRAPCKDCPFRSDRPGYLTAGRVQEIIYGMILRQATFSCHKTNEFDDGGTRETKDTQHCAGALIFLERLNRPNQMMRWMERLGAYDRTKLDMDAPVFRTPAQMKNAQPKRRAKAS